MELSGLNFSHGLSIQRHVWSTFKLPISRPDFNPREFFLVVSFGRCKFKLCPTSVGQILQATIGGVASEFRVFQLDLHVFRFSVASNLVGHFLSKLRSFDCRAYKLFFHLWNNGGPNWRFEFRNFMSDEESSWHQAKNELKHSGRMFDSRLRRTNFVSRIPARNSGFKRFQRTESQFASAAMSGDNAIPESHFTATAQIPWPPLTGANAIPVRQSVFDRLEFPKRQSVFDRLEFPSPVGSVFEAAKGPVHVSQNVNPDPDLNLGLGSKVSSENLQAEESSRICSRCLANSHPRWRCNSPIKCRACLQWGHIEANCRGKCLSGSKYSAGSEQRYGHVQGDQMTVDPLHHVAHQSVGMGAREQVLTKLSLTLDPSSSGATTSNQRRREVHQENPTSSSPPLPAPSVEQLHSTKMAYQRANPGPFVPPRMHHVEVQNRRFMVRAVANSRPTPRHEDWAIATIEPLPGNPLNFQDVSGVLDDFFVESLAFKLEPFSALIWGRAWFSLLELWKETGWCSKVPISLEMSAFHSLSITRVVIGEGSISIERSRSCFLASLLIIGKRSTWIMQSAPLEKSCLGSPQSKRQGSF